MICIAPAVEPAADMKLDDQPAYTRDANNVALGLQSDVVRGLSEAEAASRLAALGPNELPRDEPTAWWSLVLQQLRELVVLLLLGAAVVAGALGEWSDTLAILLIVAINAGLGLYQHWKAEHALAALQGLSAPTAKVVRGGVLREVPARDLVPGDRIELAAGDHVPADARLIASYSLQTLEAALTGESTPSEKDSGVLLSATTSLGDRGNMVYCGTAVAAGKASAIVTATGAETELGRVAHLLSGQALHDTPSQQRMQRLGRVLVVVCLGLVAGIAAMQLARGQSLSETVHLAVSLAVAAVPEGLPAVLTITLALGAQRLARRQALVRRLSSVETLGSVSVICTDKTGTLTCNEMTVREITTPTGNYAVTGAGYEPRGEFLPLSREVVPSVHNGTLAGNGADVAASGSNARVADSDLERLLTIGVWCNHAVVVPDRDRVDAWRVVGDPTEAALVIAARKAGIERGNGEYHVGFELPFDSERKRMSIVVRTARGDGAKVFSKGAPESLLTCCITKQCDGRVLPLTDSDREWIRRQASEMAGRALRVLALAYRDYPPGMPAEKLEQNLVFAGLVGMIDPPRQEAKEAVQVCRGAGIRPVMITGDHPRTAHAIGSELGLLDQGDAVITGAELDRCSDVEFDQCVQDARVFARVTAEHKLRIVESLRRHGKVVAMTGDGVNDAPSVKAADIGIAMGITGTDVTKESAAMVLTNDNFKTIVSAVQEGRAIYANIQRFVHYLLAGNVGKLLFMFVATVAGWPTPLQAIQILWLNLVTDGLPALALGMEPTDQSLMRRAPRNPDEPLIGPARAWSILGHGALTAAAALIGFFWVYGGNAEQLGAAQLVAFCILGCGQLAYAFVCRNEESTIFRLGWSGNQPLLIATAISLGLQLAVVFTPALHDTFGIAGYPTSEQWLLILGLSAAPAAILELSKLFKRTALGKPKKSFGNVTCRSR